MVVFGVYSTHVYSSIRIMVPAAVRVGTRTKNQSTPYDFSADDQVLKPFSLDYVQESAVVAVPGLWDPGFRFKYHVVESVW